LNPESLTGQVWDNCVDDGKGGVAVAALGGFVLGEECARASKMQDADIREEVVSRTSYSDLCIFVHGR
jgi:hypothetical protein